MNRCDVSHSSTMNNMNEKLDTCPSANEFHSVAFTYTLDTVSMNVNALHCNYTMPNVTGNVMCHLENKSTTMS